MKALTGLKDETRWGCGSRFQQSGRTDLNRRPLQPHCSALPNCATPRTGISVTYILCSPQEAKHGAAAFYHVRQRLRRRPKDTMTDTSDTPTQTSERTKSARAARLFSAAPFLADMMRVVLAMTQPRFTAGVVGVVYNDSAQILIVEHVFHPGNAWGLPGGWLGARETPAEGLRRELREELGLEVEILLPLAVETGDYAKTHLDIAYLCRAVGDVKMLSYELLSYRWIPPESMPRLLRFHTLAVEAATRVYQMLGASSDTGG